MKNTDPVLLCLFMSDNEKCNISHAPSTGFSGIQFSVVINLEGPEKKQHRGEIRLVKYRNKSPLFFFTNCM